MTMYNLVCKFCNKSFAKKGKPHQKFCGNSCSRKSKRMIEPNIYQNGWNSDNAYIAGLIWADGCLSKDNSQSGYRVTIASTDKNLILKIKSLINPHKGLYCQKPVKGNICYSLVTQEYGTISFLKENGLTERKSKNLLYPKIPNKFLSSFIRGYFDGDGSVFIQIKIINI